MLYYEKILRRVLTQSQTLVMDPPVQFTFLDPEYGNCHYLDAATPTLTLLAPVWDVSRVRLRVVSADSSCTGSVVLVPVRDGIDLPAVTVPVGSVPSVAEIPLPTVTGALALRRDHANVSDTLKDIDADGTPISCVVLNLELVICHP